jgi:hypothetical protein
MLFVQYQIWLKPPNPTWVDLATIVVVVQKLANFWVNCFWGKKLLQFGEKLRKIFRNHHTSIHGSNK